ncbi:NOB1 family endonuclease [Methanocella arvoryzae]|uniref:Ribonuclease PIN domain-containing protein n=1 Tax=Methanocella arvoryzae (strain DSM 22066 / NBRC 105507 / MRE50) TaxID=351160 RepID=Q0W2K3_METAR|nr:DNA-binding protein [Methanocella arvoryzae]CAJ37390.1 conserved hypothetical protein [Methanocella arvoryzae MRE50]
MVTTYVLDTSAFIYGTIPGDGEIVTTPGVYGEVKDEQSKLRLDMLQGLQIIPPQDSFIQAIGKMAEATGDDQRLSGTDRDLLALALEQQAAGKDVELLTDDYSVQNIARKAGLRIRALRQKKSRYGIVWEMRCTGCGRAYREGETCEVCGSPLRQKKRFATRSK